MGSRPKGGRPSGRIGRGGVGPGPAYRPSRGGKGTKHGGGGGGGGGQTRGPSSSCDMLIPIAIPMLLFYALPRMGVEYIAHRIRLRRHKASQALA